MDTGSQPSASLGPAAPIAEAELIAMSPQPMGQPSGVVSEPVISDQTSSLPSFPTWLMSLILAVVQVAVFGLIKQNWWSAAWLGIGLGLGLGLLAFDRWWLVKRYTEVGQALAPVTRSLMFLVALTVVAVFVVTSSGSSLGTGVVLGIGFQTAAELWAVRRDPTRFYALVAPGGRQGWTANFIERLVAGYLTFIAILAVMVLSSTQP
jgi:hypothetical protein